MIVKSAYFGLAQERYLEKVIEQFNMSKCTPGSYSHGSHLKLTLDDCSNDEREKENEKCDL